MPIDTGRHVIQSNDWGPGWIFEADDYFSSWCVMTFGFKLVPITENEYKTINRDRIVFISRERANELALGVIAQREYINTLKA